MALKVKINEKPYHSKKNEKKVPKQKTESNSKKKGEIVKTDKTNKHIVFGDNEDSDGKVTVKKAPKKDSRQSAKDIGKRWFEEFAKYNLETELEELKNAEIEELTNHCRKCYEAALPAFDKRNPSDAKWLKTALHKGTSKDRANAGALLVQSNPLANLDTLENLIGFTKTTNKTSTDSVDVTAELFMNSLLPPNRKLVSIALRGADWKAMRKSESIDNATKDQIFAYWHFEAAIKDQYFEFLRNVQNAIQGSQDANKNQAIICASKLLSYAPEKEQMLLSMLVNKLGDPSKMVAAKALHHLTEVSFKHPAMCGVIANETEKFLFRNNITEHAQHFALCFLSQLAPHGNVDVCVKLVNICLSFFKIVVNKGLINSKTMQAILLCLKHSIADVVKANKDTPGTDGGFMSKDTQDTIYRLVHFANIKVSLQTLALLLQIITVMSAEQQHNRFYNALYKKLLDPDLANCSAKYSALFLHIVHRAIHHDTNVARAQAFIKRLLQVALHLPVQIACGCLIIVNKLVKARSILNRLKVSESIALKGESNDTATEDAGMAAVTTYNPCHRVPEFAGAEYALRIELLALLHHFHPTVRVFAQNMIDNLSINFYGDPLIDFSLTHFLDRFAFKNPKKSDKEKPESLVQSLHNKQYTSYGSRGHSIKQLTATNCTEDERFIFEYLNKKRERQAAYGINANREGTQDIDDDEFEAYLDSLAGKKKKKNSGEDDDDDDEEFDFLGDFSEEFKDNGKKQKTGANKGDADEENDDWDSDGPEDEDSDNDGDDNVADADEDFDNDDSDGGSISLDGDDDDDDDDDDDESDIFEDDENESENEVSDPEDDDEPKSKKAKALSGKDFQRKLKNTDNMESLFAAAEDFSEMLEETSKSNKHGTLGEIFNKDKSSEKQIEWEQKRLKQGGKFRMKPKTKRNRSQGKQNRGETANNRNKKPILGKRRK